jgi:basic membrane lipoprotein Med (substrate-binding protein (PBP1-ABC) superfamily)
MLRKLLLLLALLLLVGCSISSSFEETKNVTPPEAPLKVALLLEGKIYDQGWDNQAYVGLKEIERKMNAQIFYMQYVNTEKKQADETKKLAEQGYQLIFGNGRSFETVFNNLAPAYPNTRFVFFNGRAAAANVSAINFTPESMGYFSGVVAGLMTKTHKIGLIPAYSSMYEIEPFIQAAKEQNRANKVIVREVNSWNDGRKAVQIAKRMIDEGVDILVPMGDGFNIDVLMEAHHAKRLAIGYVSDQSFVSKETVVTSILQNVADVYLKVARKYKEGMLPAGCLTFDFKDGGQDLAHFGPMVPPAVQGKVKQKLEEYKTGAFSLPIHTQSIRCQ